MNIIQAQTRLGWDEREKKKKGEEEEKDEDNDEEQTRNITKIRF